MPCVWILLEEGIGSSRAKIKGSFKLISMVLEPCFFCECSVLVCFHQVGKNQSHLRKGCKIEKLTAAWLIVMSVGQFLNCNLM